MGSEYDTLTEYIDTRGPDFSKERKFRWYKTSLAEWDFQDVMEWLGSDLEKEEDEKYTLTDGMRKLFHAKPTGKDLIGFLLSYEEKATSETMSFHLA